jgi:hypothetical protein
MADVGIQGVKAFQDGSWAARGAAWLRNRGLGSENVPSRAKGRAMKLTLHSAHAHTYMHPVYPTYLPTRCVPQHYCLHARLIAIHRCHHYLAVALNGQPALFHSLRSRPVRLHASDTG